MLIIAEIKKFELYNLNVAVCKLRKFDRGTWTELLTLDSQVQINCTVAFCFPVF